ncbi:TonB-dependent receptor [Alteraurantiacibacter palmitatis]|uniref:TonB-dependent receptor domain-containing protein n=1 Tax=Alteraurantiacibacter palmitatis TaxID=2054628 RepID=A0ABV7EAW0_9SPHN
MHIRHYLAASLATLATAMAVSSPVAAQQITSGIQGTVNDDSGMPIAGARVTVTDTRTGATRTLTTGTNGSFTISNLTVGGPYTVTANADGFEGQTLEGVTTSLQGNTSLGFSLSSGGGMIVVSAARVRLVELAVGPGTSFSGELLAAAPSFNRDIRDIIRFDPRVSLDRDDGGSGVDRISCLGGNDRGNAFTVDGISQGDIYGLNDTGFSSRSSTPLPFDAIRETQVQFAPFDVEYGNFTGCAINVVTQSGRNDFFGGGFFEYADDGMRGNQVADRPVGRITPDKRWGAYLGGPIIKDRLFFFGAYEHQEAGQSQDDGPAGAGYANELPAITLANFNEFTEILSDIYGIETGGLVTSRDFKNDRYFGRLDWQIDEDHRLELTYQRLEEASVRADDISTSATNARLAGLNTFYFSGTKSDYYSGRLYSQWSDSFSTEIRYSRSEVVDVQDPVGGGEAQDANPIPRIVVGVTNNGRSGQLLAGPGFSRAANDLTTDVDAFRFIGRYEMENHSLKFGFEVNHANLANLFVQNATGTLYFSSLANLREGILSNGTITNPTAANLVAGTAIGADGNFSASGVVTDAAAAFSRTIHSAFIQDEWTISSALSAVAGVRVDWYSGGAPKDNPNFRARYGFSNAVGFDDLDPIVMPRLALTWDAPDFGPFTAPQMRAGVGVFSGGDPVVWFGNAFQNDGRGFATGTLRDAPCPAGPVDVVVNGQFTGLPDCFRAAGIARAAAGLGDTQSISPNITQPSVQRANFGFSSPFDLAPTGFLSNWNVNLDFIYSHHRNPLTIVDLSQIPNPARGLNGFTIDGRPIYAAIDPTVAGCNAVLTDLTPAPVFSGVTAACFNTSRDDELQLTNARSFNSYIASAIVSKTFDGGVFTENGSTYFNVGYAFTNARDRRNMYNSTAGSNYDLTAAFDRQDPAASPGYYASRHNLTTQLNFREEFFADYATRLGISFIARSGRPYSLTFTGSGIFNDSVSGADNVLAYLPTGVNDPNISPTSNVAAVQELVAFIDGLKCARKFIGTSIPRNTCTNDWYYDLDLSFSQEVPFLGSVTGVAQDRLRLFATFDNFLNFLDKDANIHRRRDFAGRQDVATVSGVDAQGRYIFTAFNPDFELDNQINVSSSVWRLKVGVSYSF